MKTVEFFFDYTCPYAYLASTRIEALCARTGATLVWRPMLLGGLFRALDTPTNLAATMHPTKAAMLVADQRRWADLWQVELGVPRPGGYARSVDALRATLAVAQDEQRAVIHALYRAHWVTHRDIGEPAVLRAVLDEAGVDGAAVIAKIDDGIKEQLRANTDEAARRGAFGAPAMFVGDALYFGQDRLAMLEAHLGGTPVDPGATRFVNTVSSEAAVEFFFDPSSPFAFLGSVGLERLCERLGARVIWRPILLGGLFKSLGGPTVPLATFSVNKQRWITEDLERWARHWGVEYRFSPHFPVKTLRAQRIAAALAPASDDGDFSALARWARRTFCAVWQRGEDVEDEATLAQCLRDCALAPALIEKGNDPAIKQALIDRTEHAKSVGAFGVPTFRVHTRAGATAPMFWGQDRLALVERALQGWDAPSWG